MIAKWKADKWYWYWYMESYSISTSNGKALLVEKMKDLNLKNLKIWNMVNLQGFPSVGEIK
jgi:hypothetical protein